MASYHANLIEHVELPNGIVPPGVLQIVRQQLTRLTAESNNTCGLTLLFSLAIALWRASARIKAMLEAMNVAYHERERRSFFVFNRTALLFTLGARRAAGGRGSPCHAHHHRFRARRRRSRMDRSCCGQRKLCCWYCRSAWRRSTVGGEPERCQMALDHAGRSAFRRRP